MFKLDKELTVKEAIEQGEPILLFHGDVYGHEHNKKVIEISKEGRYIHAVKTDSIVNYSFDLKEGHYIKHKRGEDTRVDTAKITGWFYGNDVITYDYKFGLLILYNKYHHNFSQYRSVARFIEALKNPGSLYYEQWVGVGVDLEATHILLALKNNGSHVSCEYQRLFTPRIRKAPSDVDKALIELLKKRENVGLTLLNDYIDNFSPKRHSILSKLFDYAKNEDYEDVFKIRARHRYNNSESNILTDNSWQIRHDRNRFLDLIENYNLQLERFIPYLRDLLVFEHTDLSWIIDNYSDYLDAELFLRNGKMRKVNKYPNNLVQMHHNRTAVIRDIERERKRREDELERKNEHLVYEAGLKYQDIRKRGDFSMIVPDGPEDVIDEGNNLGHCVGGYTRQIRKGKTFIVFMRKRKEPEVSFITVEIKNGEVCTALGRHNRRLEKNEREWLEKYAERHDLKYTAYAPLEEVI